MNKYGFFSSMNGDRKYSAEDFCSYFKDIFTDGILGDSAANLRVSSAGGMAVSVSAGTAYIQGHFYRPDTAEMLTVSSADTTYGRKDRVVIRLDREQRMIYPALITGVPAAAPSSPDIVRDGSYYDIGIAVINVAANAAVISAADITDTRFDNAVCGIVTGVVDTIDTAELFRQYEARWDMLMAGFSGDEVEIIAAFNGLLTVKTVNGIAPASGGNVALTIGDIPTGNGAYKPDKLIQCGKVTTVISDNIATADVVFDTAYTSAPIISVSCEAVDGYMPMAAISNITQNGFTVRTTNQTNYQMSATVHWIAMGV